MQGTLTSLFIDGGWLLQDVECVGVERGCCVFMVVSVAVFQCVSVQNQMIMEKLRNPQMQTHKTLLPTDPDKSLLTL